MMKKYLVFLVLFVVAMAQFSCQKEESRLITGEGQLNRNSELTTKLQQVTTNDTRVDNVIDSSDCFSVKLPVQVLVSGQQVTVSGAQDYALVEEMFNGTPAGGSIAFEFPITVIDSAYQETIVGADAFEALVQNCVAPEPASCFSFQYPISVTAYDTASQQPINQTIDRDEEFYLFLENLPATAIYELNFPIGIVDSSGQVISVSGNESLNAAIEAATAACACNNPQILTQDLILYMPFANEVADLTGFGQVGVIGEVTFVEDRSLNPNGAVWVNPNTQTGFVSVIGNANNDLIQNNAFTVSLWFNLSTTDLSVDYLFSNSEFILGQGVPGQFDEIRAPFALAPGMPFLADPTWQIPQNLGFWHHLVATWDGTVLTLYVDGNAVAESTQPEFPQQMLGYLIGEDFSGFLDDVRVYRRALNSTEVGTLFELEGDVNTCLE